jgi:hypothetical protein
MTDQEYREVPGISASMIKEFMRSPAHYKYMQEYGKDTASLTEGRITHIGILQQEKLWQELYVVDKSTMPEPERDFRVTANKDWKKHHEEEAAKLGKDMIYTDQIDYLEDMRNKLKDRGYWWIIEKGQIEWPVFRKIDGINYKGKLDIVHPDFVADYKTTQTAKPGQFEREIFRYNYHVQGALYCDLAGVDTFKIIAQEKNPPYECFMYTLSDEVLQAGRDLYQEYAERLKTCMERDIWPGYDADMVSNETIVELPKWLKSE